MEFPTPPKIKFSSDTTEDIIQKVVDYYNYITNTKDELGLNIVV